jgi:glutaredoxin
MFVVFMAKITLYQFETCPYCAKVRTALDAKGVKYEKVNVDRDRESSQRKDLLEKSNVATVPVIEIDGKFIGESDVIVKYLEDNL